MYKDKIIDEYLQKNTNIYDKERIESIQKMLSEFESNNIISSEMKDYYNNILSYCNELDSWYENRDKE